MPGGGIGVGIIGCGRIFDLHMRGYQGRDDAAVPAVADICDERRRERTERCGIPRHYADYCDLLEDHSIGLVEILAPHHLHCEMAVAAAQAGGACMAVTLRPRSRISSRYRIDGERGSEAAGRKKARRAK